MAAPAFDYAAAASYDEAVRLLAAAGDEAKILAGGQSLLPMLNLRLARPALLIDINPADQRQPSLAAGGAGGAARAAAGGAAAAGRAAAGGQAGHDGGSLLRLPALTRHRVLLEHDLVRRWCPLLAEAARHVGNVRVRNRGTVGGSLAHADPASEIGCCALAAGARIVARGPDGDRTVPAGELFAGYWTTTLAASEVITDVLIPAARPRQGWSFQELARRASDFAIVAVAALVELDERAERIAAARVALAGVADRVTLAAPGLLAGLAGAAAGRAGADIDAVAAGIAGSLRPASDVRASGAYRRRLARVLAGRALRQALARACGDVS
ncbi:MAG TPA: FAD binding domain-containing protein [Streptosporangiaceae bacterium]|jgi:carbon-monoxide dehydrogenase medium subunit|nr:FAD binding domain-containing protein [Streptosporangiaceae bacterium]